MLPLTFRPVQAFGLRIHTQMRIPGAVASTEDDDTRADLYIRYGPVERLRDDVAFGPYRFDSGDLSVEIPHAGLFLYRHSTSTLTVQTDVSASSEFAEAMLISTVLPAVLWMRGHIVLHAAAVLMNGCSRALAFAAPSGGGKSTLLLGLLDMGASVIAEDVCRLDPSTLNITGLPGLLLLRSSYPDGSDSRREHIVPAAQQLGSATLAAFIALNEAGGFSRLSGPAALEALLQNFHRPRVPQLLGQMPMLLSQVASLVPRLPVYSVNRSLDSDALKRLRILAE